MNFLLPVGFARHLLEKGSNAAKEERQSEAIPEYQESNNECCFLQQRCVQLHTAFLLRNHFQGPLPYLSLNSRVAEHLLHARCHEIGGHKSHGP